MGRGTWKRGQYQQSANNWQQGYGGSQQALTQGVGNPKRSPTQAALGAANTMVQNWNNSTAGGAQSQWGKALAQSGDGAWQAGMTQFAQSGLAQKAQKGNPHYAAFAQTYGPAVVQAAAQLPQRGDFATNQQRAQAMAQWEHNQRGKYRKLWRGGV